MRSALLLAFVSACSFGGGPYYPNDEACLQTQYETYACRSEYYVWSPPHYTVWGNYRPGHYDRSGPGPRVRDHRRW